MTVPAPVRKLVLLGTPVLAAAVMVLAAAVLADQLPAEVPSHWGTGGLSDDTMPLWAYTGLFGTLAVSLGLGFQSLRHRLGEPVSQRLVGGLGVGMAVWMAALHVGTLLAARGTTGPIPFPTTAFVGSFVAAFVATALAAAVVRPIERHGELLAATPIAVEPGEAVVWSGQGVAAPWTWMLLGTALLPVPIVVVVGLAWLAVLLVAVGLVAMTVLRVRVTVGPQGVVARTGPFGLVRFGVPLDDVTEVHAEVIDPLHYGGWGLRFLPGVRGLVVRNGPGLRIERTDGPTLVVTVDGAAEAAGVLQAHLSSAATD